MTNAEQDRTTDYERVLSALMLWRESRSCIDAMPGIYHVTLNRVADRRWPDNVVSVILQPHQFSSFVPGDPNAVKFPSSDDKEINCALRVVNSPGDDPTGGANHYHSGKVPRWAAAMQLVAEIGPFKFYRG